MPEPDAGSQQVTFFTVPRSASGTRMAAMMVATASGV